MTQQNSEQEFAEIVALLNYYRFDCDRYPTDTLVLYWCIDYPLSWVKSAVVEALYQGRYKSLSVEQILQGWQRRNQPTYHFSHDFERLIYSQLPIAETIAARKAREARRGIFAERSDSRTTDKISSPRLESRSRTKADQNKSNSSRYATVKQPIDKFTPDVDVNIEEIYRKLQILPTPGE
ncbi:MAG: hypothetical protein HC916_20010 [Coleofasciculaceae cyanobacterium SM2_1_6]|nr:hypothetical protein [Coleofasciculaceae cyanobacterium SM2_1_6]